MSESVAEGPGGRPRSHLVLAVIWAVALAYALRLSAGDRGLVDWLVLGVIVGAMVWQLWRLGVRLYGSGGPPAAWHLLRTLGFWAIGLMNTVWAVPGAEGSWKWWGGMAVLAVAAGDTVALFLKERRALR